MDDNSKRFVQRLIRRIPLKSLEETLKKWDRLSREQLQSLDFTDTKRILTEDILAICEENHFTFKHLTELEMIHFIDNPDHRMWYTFRLMDPEKDADAVDLKFFKEQFKAHLSELMTPVSVRMKKHTDEAVWIRIAWSSRASQIDHLKPTFVYYIPHKYVFVTNLSAVHQPKLFQAMVLSTRYKTIKDANLRGMNLFPMRDLLMKDYQKTSTTDFPSPLTEINQAVSDPRIEREQAAQAANRWQMACEAFGNGVLPHMESAVYNLQTKFKDRNNKTMTARDEPFKCAVKFTSTNLLESFRHCAASGIASSVTPLLSSIMLKRRNYFVITDNGPSPHSKHRSDGQQSLN